MIDSTAIANFLIGKVYDVWNWQRGRGVKPGNATQRYVAQVSKVDDGTLSRLMNGEGAPSAETVVKLSTSPVIGAEFLGVLGAIPSPDTQRGRDLAYLIDRVNRGELTEEQLRQVVELAREIAPEKPEPRPATVHP